MSAISRANRRPCASPRACASPSTVSSGMPVIVHLTWIQTRVAAGQFTSEHHGPTMKVERCPHDLRNRFARSLLARAACVGRVWSKPHRRRVTPAPTCRDLEQRFEVLKAEIIAGPFQSAAVLCRRMRAARRSRAGCWRPELRWRPAIDSAPRPLARAARVGTRRADRALPRPRRGDRRAQSRGCDRALRCRRERAAGEVALLLAKGADPNLPGPSGVTPLAAAAFKGNGRIVETLLARGADPNVVDATGKAAITYAAARALRSSCAGCSMPASMPSAPTATT